MGEGGKVDKANSRGKRGGESEARREGGRGCLVHHAHRINFQSDKFWKSGLPPLPLPYFCHRTSLKIDAVSSNSCHLFLFLPRSPLNRRYMGVRTYDWMRELGEIQAFFCFSFRKKSIRESLCENINNLSNIIYILRDLFKFFSLIINLLDNNQFSQDKNSRLARGKNSSDWYEKWSRSVEHFISRETWSS